MAKIKAIIIKSKKKSNNTYPVYIRINEGQKQKDFATGCYIKMQEWDPVTQQVKKSDRNYVVLNSIINKVRRNAEQSILAVMATDDNPHIIESLNHKQKKKVLSNFFAVADIYFDELRKGKKFTRLSADAPRVKHLKEFRGSEVLRFDEIDVSLLNKFMLYLKSRRKVQERTIMNHLVTVRTIYNYAIREGVADKNLYPFGKGNVVIRFPETMKVGLSGEEVRLLEELDLSKQPHLVVTIDIWLFSFYLAGMRISDVLRLKWKDCLEERLTYQMGKNKKVVSLKFPAKASEILNKYKPVKKRPDLNSFVFGELNGTDEEDEHAMSVRICSATNKFDRHLKVIAELAGIHKNLSCHISRHTFGNITGDKISPQVLQKLYRHTDIKTTMGYQSNFIHADVDDALEKVLKF